jgi:hypothetical protein
MKNRTFRSAKAFLVTALLLCLSLTGCNPSGSSSAQPVNEVEEVAVEYAASRMESDAEGIASALPTIQRERIDLQSLVSISKKDRVIQEVMLPHVSVSADTSIVQGEHGYVQVVMTLPDVKQVMGAMSPSDRMALRSAMRNEENQEVRSRLQKAFEVAKDKLGELPTTEQYEKVYVVRSEEEWKVVFPDDIEKRLENGYAPIKNGNWEAPREALEYARGLAPMMRETKRFAQQVAEQRIDRGRYALRTGNLEAAENALAYVEDIAPDMGKTKDFADEISGARGSFLYADSLSTSVSFAKASSPPTRYSDREITFGGKVEVQNKGKKDVESVYVTATVDFNSSVSTLQDTTVARNIRVYRVGGGVFKAGETTTGSFRAPILEDVTDKVAEEVISVGDEEYQVELIPARAEFE